MSKEKQLSETFSPSNNNLDTTEILNLLMEKNKGLTGIIKLLREFENLEDEKENGFALDEIIHKIRNYVMKAKLPNETIESINTWLSGKQSHIEKWKYWKDAPPEYSGYKGFFKEINEIQCFLDGLPKIKK